MHIHVDSRVSLHTWRVWINTYTYRVYVFIETLHHWQDVAQGQFLSGVQLV